MTDGSSMGISSIPKYVCCDTGIGTWKWPQRQVAGSCRAATVKEDYFLVPVLLREPISLFHLSKKYLPIL
jgi:hypothetical protein